MPQLVKGGKWIFGWVIVGPQREIAIPPEAYREYGFRAGEQVIFLRGSRRSGGFSVGRVGKVPAMLKKRALARAQMGEQGRLAVPPENDVQPNQRLLVVRGSGLALGFLAQGPIYEEALKHPELITFQEAPTFLEGEGRRRKTKRIESGNKKQYSLFQTRRSKCQN